jgi:hypothetical protein
MRRALAILAVMAGAGLAAASRASAQQPITFYFGGSQTDTAVGLVPGSTGTVPVRFLNPGLNSYPYYQYLAYARITVHFDPSKVAVLGAQGEGSGLYTIASFTAGSGVATVEASGFVYGADQPAIRLQVQLQAGVTDGAYLWLQPDSVRVWSYTLYNYGVAPGLSRIGQACHATQVWGDVDANSRVDSRDALITLSAAVGLPVSGFDLLQGDVDEDGLTNSRDALMMLSYSIGLAPSVSTALNRTGVGVPDACPALTPPGETTVFVRSGAGSGIQRLDSLSTSPVPLTANPGDQWPRLNGAGTTVAFQCPDSVFGYGVCSVPAAGGVRSPLVTGFGFSAPYPDWSPDGSHLSLYWAPEGAIVTVDSLGAGLTYIYVLPTPVTGGMWSRDGTRFLYGNTSLSTALATSPYTYSAVGGSPGDVQTAPLRWSPDGLTVAFKRGDSRIWALPSGGGAAPAPLTWFADAIGGFDWGPQGIVFSMPDTHRVPSLWLLQGGPNGPLVRLTGTGQADDQPSFRRNP